MYLYENALIEDINRLFVNSNVKAMISDSLDESLRRSAAENNDITTLPLVTLVGGDWELNDTSFYNLMHGSENHRIYDVAKAVSNISFTPSYDMYIAASSSRECDMLTRELIFHYYQYPTLTVKIPYGLNTIHTFNIIFNRSVRKYTRPGLVYRIISFTLNGAYLWHNNSMNVIKKVDVDVEERIELTNV